MLPLVKAYTRHVPDAGNLGASLPAGLAIRSGRVWTILRFTAGENDRSHGSDAAPHLHGRDNQEAAWQALVKVSGSDFS
jgi:hypothetical protein